MAKSKNETKSESKAEEQLYKITLEREVEHEGDVYKPGEFTGSKELCEILLQKQAEAIDQKGTFEKTDGGKYKVVLDFDSHYAGVVYEAGKQYEVDKGTALDLQKINKVLLRENR